MYLWLSLLWVAACAVGFVVYVFCRKWIADIGHEVAEEVDHQIRRVLKAAREAEEQLRDTFLNFQNPSAAVQTFQKARGEIVGAPRASPQWNWTDADLELLRKQSIAAETDRRSRPRVVGSIVGVVVLAICVGVVTVILSNSVQPVMAPPTMPAIAASNAGGALPPPVNLSPVTPPTNWPPSAPASASLPTLPPALPAPADVAGNAPIASAQGPNNGVNSAQGGALTQPTSGQTGATQTNPTTAITNPASTAGSTPSPVSPSPAPPAPSVPPAPPASAASAANTSNTAATPAQDTNNGATSVKTVAASDPDQTGETP
jgi:uncharacterized membrane protein SpoIIM required for sporulation